MSQYFHNYTDVTLSLVGFGLFLAVFIGWMIRVNRQGNKELYNFIANQILQDGETTCQTKKIN